MKILTIVGTILILLYLIYSRSMWFSGLEEQIDIGRDRITKQIDLSSSKIITWKIHEDEWDYTGEVRVALIVDKMPEIPWEAYDKEAMDLKVTMDAYAITYERSASGRDEVLRANRLIRNWYFTTDEPLSEEARIWGVGSSEGREYGLCGLYRYRREDTYIVFDILEADPLLAKANPRLEVVGEHDYAVSHHIGTARIMRDIALGFLALCTVTIGLQALRNNKGNKI